jgi:Conserved hypothetical protein 95
MRIVGGRLGGRTLAGPKSQAIRPTSDRLRESLFNILAHGHGDPVTGARVLDLFAGTGALGLEAVSRGAGFALLIDDGAEARALMRQNVEALGLGGVTRIFRRDATKLGPVHPLEPFSPKRSSSSRRRRMRISRRPKASQNSTGAATTTASSFSWALSALLESFRPPSRPPGD